MNLALLVILLAHGADPTPLDWPEALARLVQFGGFSVGAITLLWLGFGRTAHKQDGDQEEQPTSASGWSALGLVVLAMFGWWLLRTASVEMMTQEPSLQDHSHTPVEGGQVAMWWDFHAEVARIESGELRVFVTDSYDRRVSADFYQVEVTPESGIPRFMEPSLDGSFRFLRLPRNDRQYSLKISTPGWNVTLNFLFDEERGRRSLPFWCGTPM